MVTGQQIMNGVIVLDQPLVVKFLDFAYEHMDCDSIAARASIYEPYQTQIVAYASSKDYNAELKKIYQEQYDGNQYVIMKHVSEAEAYSID